MARDVSPRIQVSPPEPKRWVVPVAIAFGLAAGLALASWSIKAPPPGMAGGQAHGASGESSAERPLPNAPPEDGEFRGARVPGRDDTAAGERRPHLPNDSPGAGSDEPSSEPSDERFDERSEETTSPEGATGTEAPTGALTGADGAGVVRRAASDIAFERGRLAYIACPGVEGADGRCPRDRELESRVWAVLEGLGNCPDWPSRAYGTGDVRLHLRPDGATLRFRDWGEAPLPLGPLRACLAPAVEGLRTTIPADPVVVSFRFRLAGR